MCSNTFLIVILGRLFKTTHVEPNQVPTTISWPFNAVHKTHVHIDIHTGKLTLDKASNLETGKDSYDLALLALLRSKANLV